MFVGWFLIPLCMLDLKKTKQNTSCFFKYFITASALRALFSLKSRVITGKGKENKCSPFQNGSECTCLPSNPANRSQGDSARV